jgi:hypothetical protein
MQTDNLFTDISEIELVQLDVDDLIPFPDNRNIENTEIDILAKQIYSSGFISAITVAREYGDTFNNNGDHIPTGKYVVLDGHRRVEALKYIYENTDPDYKNKQIPCQVFVKPLSYKSMYVINILGNQRKAETPKEIRERTLVLSELVKEGVITNISKSISKIGNMSRRTYYFYTSINENLIDGLKECFDEGQISLNACSNLAKKSKEFQSIVYDYCSERKGIVIQAQDIEKLEQRYLEERNAILSTQVSEMTEQELIRRKSNYANVKKSRDKSRRDLDDKILELISDLIKGGKVHGIYEAINTVDPQNAKETEFALLRLENDVKRLERRLKNNGTASETQLRRLDVAIRKLQDIGTEYIRRNEQIENYLRKKK